jgi:hypothetical protein
LKKLILTLLLFVFACDSNAIIDVEMSDEDIYLRVYPIANSNYMEAYFALHVPDFEGNLRGILVIVPGFNSDGRYYKDEAVFREFAREERLAIVSCYYRGDQDYYNYYDNVSRGSGPALMRVIDEFALRKEMPELKNVPLLLWGHSAGGMFSYAFTNWRPDIVAACTPVRSAEFVIEPSDSAKNTPVMFQVGEYDDVIWVRSCIDFCVDHRAQGALWGYAIEPGATHQIAYSTDLSLPFFSAVLRKRVGEGVSHYSQMLPVDSTDCWLGNYYTKMIYSYLDYPGDKSQAAWLPDSASADTWKKYCEGENIE